MLSFTERLDVAEVLSDKGEHAAALAQLNEMKRGLEPGQSAHLHLVRSSIIARSGRLRDALTELRLAEALANASARVDVALEVQVTRASIHAALGEYDVAIPMLAKAVSALGAHPELSELHGDAVAELEAYQNLMSSKPSRDV